MAQDHALLTTAQVAAALHVTGSTVTRWARDGKLPAVVLPSGRRRFHRDDIDALLATDGADPAPVAASP